MVAGGKAITALHRRQSGRKYLHVMVRRGDEKPPRPTCYFFYFFIFFWSGGGYCHYYCFKIGFLRGFCFLFVAHKYFRSFFATQSVATVSNRSTPPPHTHTHQRHPLYYNVYCMEPLAIETRRWLWTKIRLVDFSSLNHRFLR